jgi:hypothetical protein
MRNRLRMAAWALAAGVAWAPSARAGDPPVANRVNLDVQISGLGRAGCEIEIRPGHPACQFRPIAATIRPEDSRDPLKLRTIAIDARSLGADRDCSFSITVKEPGQPPKTFRRGVRLAATEPGKPTPTQSLRCYLNTAAIAAKDKPATPRR